MVDTQRLVYECNLAKKGHQILIYSTFKGELLKKSREEFFSPLIKNRQLIFCLLVLQVFRFVWTVSSGDVLDFSDCIIAGRINSGIC